MKHRALPTRNFGLSFTILVILLQEAHNLNHFAVGSGRGDAFGRQWMHLHEDSWNDPKIYPTSNLSQKNPQIWHF